MKTCKKIAAQGDCLIIAVDEIPGDATEQPQKKFNIITHSETGHHHAIEADGVVRFDPKDPLVCYLRIDAAHADLVHHRNWDTHETIRLPGNGQCYEIRRQREWSPEGWRRVQD